MNQSTERIMDILMEIIQSQGGGVTTSLISRYSRSINGNRANLGGIEDY